jgi:polyphosphate glucokinase
VPGENFDRFIGKAALDAVGLEAWNARVRASIDTITGLTNCDVLYIGGGNARKLQADLPPHVKVVSNAAGVTGGVRLWEPEMDSFFAGEINAQWPSRASRKAP